MVPPQSVSCTPTSPVVGGSGPGDPSYDGTGQLITHPRQIRRDWSPLPFAPQVHVAPSVLGTVSAYPLLHTGRPYWFAKGADSVPLSPAPLASHPTRSLGSCLLQLQSNLSPQHRWSGGSLLQGKREAKPASGGLGVPLPQGGGHGWGCDSVVGLNAADGASW